MWASKSLYSHMGIVELKDGKPFVLEAIAKVSETPIEKWINRGRLNRFAVYRYKNLQTTKREEIVAAAKKLLGRPYDIYFSTHNDSIYCSELAGLAYQAAGLMLGKWQKVSELDVDNFLARTLIKKRSANHPACRGKKITTEKCWENILADEVLSPDSVASDKNLELVYSNYP